MIQETYPARLEKIFRRGVADKARTIALIGGAGMFFAMNLAYAASLPGDLSISSSNIKFDTDTFSTTGASTSITGSSVSATVGGAVTTASFNEAGPLPDPLEENPTISGNFTDPDDGFGITVNAQTSNSDPSLFSNFYVGVDMGFGISNTSVADTYDVVIKWMFNNSVTAAGADAYSSSIFDLFVDSSSVFTDIAADTALGNQFDSDPVDPAVYGGTVTDVDTLLFTLTLAPGDMFSVTGAYELDGGAFEGATSASFSSFLSIDSVAKHGAAAVPEPTTMLLFGVGLAGLTAVQRRRKRS